MQFIDKKKVCNTYSEFVESLSQRQNSDWEKVLEGLRKIYPDKSNEELFNIAHLSS